MNQDSAPRGLVLGKFMPPHAGHMRLVKFAEAYCEGLGGRASVVVGSLASEPIPGELRARWMEELAPRSGVLHLPEELPQDPSEDPRFWDLWRTALLGVLGQPPTHVFASEAYGAKLAEALGATFVPLERPTEQGAGPLFVSGTAVREDPWQHWDLLPELVRPHFLQRIHIVGPESTGKSTLARRLAEAFGTVWVPEYARTWLTREGAPMHDGHAVLTPEDMPLIARGHRASCSALERAARHRIFVDTDALATEVWSKTLFGSVSPEVLDMRRRERPDLSLLLQADVPWIDDEVRYLPAARESFFQTYADELAKAGRSFVVLKGSFEERFEGAKAAVEALPRPGSSQ